MKSNVNLRKEINTNSISVVCINFSRVRRDILLVLYKVCSPTFSIYLFLRFAGVSYGRFIAVRFGFNLSTYIQNIW